MCIVFRSLIYKIVATIVVLAVFTFSNEISAQVLVAGTQFTPQTITAGKTYYGINDQILQYGLIGGTITLTPPLTPSTNAGVFNGTAYYAITTNPDTLDNAQYENILGSSKYMLVFSPPNFASGGTVLKYTVNGLAVGSNVSVEINYCNVERSTNNNTCVGQTYPLKGVINPNQYNPTNGDNTSTQVGPSQCGTYTWTQSSGSSQIVQPGGEIVFNLNQAQGGSCEAMAITAINIYGTPKPTISSSEGTSVCTGQQSILSLAQTYDSATYQWQSSTGGAYSNISGATTNAYLATAGTANTTANYRLNVTYKSQTFTSDTLSIGSVSCCVSGGSRQTVYYNDFGTFDLTLDPTGKTYLLWNYANYLAPVQETLTTTTPFQYPLATPPPGTTFVSGGSVGNNQYTVAAGMNGYVNYTYPGNGVTYTPAQTSDLQWAGDVGGFSAQPEPAFDHSGSFEGAALFINVPANSEGDIIYSQTITGLCPNATLYFQAYMNVFTSSGSGGTYWPVNLQVKLIDGSNAANVYSYVDSTTAADQYFPGTTTYGCGCWVPLTGQLTLGPTSTSMIFELVQNQNDNANGDDLVLDDITVMACSPPSVQAVFNTSTLATTTTVCTSTMDIYALASTATTYWSGAGQTPLDYLFQYTYTPSVSTSWTSLGSVLSTSTYSMTTPDANSVFTGTATGNNVYFRVVVGPHGTLNTSTNYSETNVCSNYSVSGPISASVQCPLPVKLISFEGSHVGNTNMLTWATASELDNNYFQVEKSSDGKNFTPIGQVSGEGTSSVQHSYRFIDNSPANGINYYRLKQVDFSGAYYYSNTVALQDDASSDAAADISVFPNPNSGSFSVALMNPGLPYTLEITDVQGQQVYYSSGASAPETVKISGLAQGLYIVQVTINNQVITKKVVVY